MHWHMQKASFRHVRSFPGEVTKRDLRKRSQADSHQTALLADGGEWQDADEAHTASALYYVDHSSHRSYYEPTHAATGVPKTALRLPQHSASAIREEQRSDPRLAPTCSGYWGSWAPGVPIASDLIVRTVEDVVANRSVPPRRSLRKQFGTCNMPYGRFGQGDTFYMEIPKTGSTTLKARFTTKGTASDALPPGFPAQVQKSFAIVREPLDRMLSGYGTLVKRLQSRLVKRRWPPFLSEVDEAKRFEGFVDYLTSHTDEELASKNHNTDCVWQHVMTQMWFFDLYPNQVEFIGRLEELETELEFIRLRLNVTFGEKGNGNRHEGDLDDVDVQHLSRTVPHAVEKLLAHLRQDYECLQYPMPSVEKLAFNKGV